MWHVDEGALHAYLDGALDEYPAAEARRVREHLEACAECSERLEEERRLRAESQQILGLAAPRVDVPSFEELRAYVRAQAPRRTTASTRLYRLGWAASVAIALGTGWLLRGGSTPAVLGTGASSSAPVGASASSPSTDRVAESAFEAEEQARTNEIRAAGGAEPRTAEAVTGSAPARQPSAVAGGAALDEVVAARAPDATSVRAETRPEVGQVGDAVVGRSAGALATLLADSADRDDVTSKAAADAPDVFAANARRAAPEPAAPSAASGAPAPDAVRQDAAAPARDSAPAAQAAPRIADQRLSSAIAVPAPVAQSVVGGTALTRDADAEPLPPPDAAEAEGTALVVPGLEVLDVLPVGQGTTFAGMRALQRLQQGDTLELFHLPAGIDPSSLPPLRPEWNQIVRQRGAGWLVMRAELPESSLIELLQRLESAR